MEDADLKRLKDAFRTWAENVPQPDEPAIGFLGGKFLSAREAADAVDNQTEDGAAILEILEHGVAREGLDAVIERLTRRAPG